MRIPEALLIMLLLATTASASGIGVTPAELSFNIEKGKTQQRELAVYNLGDSAFELDVTSDSDFLRFSHTGRISANGKGKVVVEADAKKLKEGVRSGSIYITAGSQSSGVRLNLGTAVKANVEVFTLKKTSAVTGTITSSAIVLFGLLAYLAAERLRGYFASQKA